MLSRSGIPSTSAVAATDLGVTAFKLLEGQRDGHGWMHIAETPFSRALDEERRRQWGLIDEPERPERPARRYFEDRGDYSLEPSRSEYGALTIPRRGFHAGAMGGDAV